MRPGLLIIDMQNDLIYHEKRQARFSKIISPLKELINCAHSHNIPIFYTKFALDPHDAQFKKFGEIYCVKGTSGCDIIDELKPLHGPVIEKQKNSAFFGTPLDRMLKQKNVDTLVLCGVQTQICIMTTAADASFREYKVLVVEDCVESTREDKKNWALQWIKEYAGNVLSLSAILSLLKEE